MTTRLATNSEIQDFKRCRRQWWLRWYRRLAPRRDGGPGPLSLGNRIHRALAALYDPAVWPAVEPMWAVFNEDAERDRVKFATQAAEDPLPSKVMAELENELKLGRIMLEGYLQWLTESGADEYLEVLEAETERRAFFAEVNGVQVYLVDKLDARVLDKASGARRFIDHKTSAQPAALLKVGHLDEQMRLYHLVEYLKLLEDGAGGGERTDGAILNVLKKVMRTASAKPPFYERLEIRHNETDLRSFWLRTFGVVRDLLDTEARLGAGEDPLTVVYPTPTRDCSWDCPFFGVCPMFDDGSDAEGTLAASFVERHPMAGRYSVVLTAEEDGLINPAEHTHDLGGHSHPAPVTEGESA